MIKQKQLFRHNPTQGTIGDCHRTAIACLLNKKPEEVPHFGELHFGDSEAWQKAEIEYLATQGFSRFFVYYNAQLIDVLEAMKVWNPGVHYLLGGMSRNGVNHTVIGLDDAIVWDPAIDNSGIVGPLDNGLYSIQVFIPLLLVSRETPV